MFAVFQNEDDASQGEQPHVAMVTFLKNELLSSHFSPRLEYREGICGSSRRALCVCIAFGFSTSTLDVSNSSKRANDRSD